MMFLGTIETLKTIDIGSIMKYYGIKQESELFRTNFDAHATRKYYGTTQEPELFRTNFEAHAPRRLDVPKDEERPSFDFAKYFPIRTSETSESSFSIEIRGFWLLHMIYPDC